MIRRPPRSTLSSSSAASDVYKRQLNPVTRTCAGAFPHALRAPFINHPGLFTRLSRIAPTWANVVRGTRVTGAMARPTAPRPADIHGAGLEHAHGRGDGRRHLPGRLREYRRDGARWAVPW